MFKNIESEDKTKYDSFYSSSKGETVINQSRIGDVFQFEQTFKNLLEKVQARLLIQSVIILLVFQSMIL